MSLKQDLGLRPRRPSKDTFRKQIYWTTQANPEQPPWYVWDSKLPLSRGRSRSEEKTSPVIIPGCDPSDIRKDVREYLLTSTLHGLRYVGEKKLTWFERFFWLAAFGCSLVCAAFFIMNVYTKWRMSPMIVSVNPEDMPLTSLPFPALTICNVNQAKKSVAERYKESGDQVDKKLLESLCSTQSDAEIFEDTVADNADWNHTRSFLINVTQPCNEMLSRCTWNSKQKSCEDLFNAQLTDEGLCCTFNAVHRNKMFRNPNNLNDMNITFPSPAVDWTPEEGYPPDAPPDGFPWKPKGVGTHHGLTLVVDANIAEYYCASTKSLGFKVLLHNPTETPKIANLGEIFGPGVEARLSIQPKILDAQPALRSIDISKRLCVFSSEKELVFFRTYTLKNCEMECEARSMLEVCNCVLYYMPKNRTTRVCGKGDAKCYQYLKGNITRGSERLCDECLPACTEISYGERMSTAPLNKDLIKQLAKSLGDKTPDYFIIDVFRLEDKIASSPLRWGIMVSLLPSTASSSLTIRQNMLVIHFYFDNNRFIRYTKGEIFGLTEFLSNTGGLLGLCMGFSMMSFVELIYYCTLRAMCLARKRRPKPFTK